MGSGGVGMPDEFSAWEEATIGDLLAEAEVVIDSDVGGAEALRVRLASLLRKRGVYNGRLKQAVDDGQIFLLACPDANADACPAGVSTAIGKTIMCRQ